MKNAMGAPIQKRHYSAEWANRTFQEWYAKSPRATDFVLQIIGISRSRAVQYLMQGEEQWEDIKSCRKMLLRLNRFEIERGIMEGFTDDRSTFVELMELNVRSLWEQLSKKRALES